MRVRAILALCAFAGCAVPTQNTPGTERILLSPTQLTSVVTSCQAAQFQRLVGVTHDDLLQTRILGPVRVIRPNQAVTTDFLPNRLNIELDEEETVTRVTCG